MTDSYPVEFAVEYPDRRLNRVTTRVPNLHGDQHGRGGGRASCSCLRC